MKKSVKKSVMFLMTTAMLGCCGMAVLFNNIEVKASETMVFAMETGASVKVNGDGLRFRVKMDETTANTIKTDDTKKLVAYLAPKTYFDAVKDGKYVNLLDKLTITIEKEKIYQADGFYWGNACVYNVKDVNRDLVFSAVACIEDIDAEEADKYTYATVEDGDINNVARSQYYVINAATLDSELNADTKSQLATTYSWYGTEEYPISIETVDGYNAFITDVNNGNTFEGKYFTVKEGLDSTVEMEGTLSATQICTVQFDSKGGSSVATQSVVAGQSAQRPTNPTKQGCTFGGWMLGGEEYDFGVVTENITLVAKWNVETSSAVNFGKLTFSEYPDATEYKVYYGESEDACTNVLDSQYIDMKNCTANISSTATTITERINGKSPRVYYQVVAVVDGVENKYTTIYTGQELIDTFEDFKNLINTGLNNNYYLVHDIECGEMTPFADLGKYLTGTLEGNGYALKNLKMKTPTATTEQLYILPHIGSTGVVRNLCIDGFGASYVKSDRMIKYGAITAYNEGLIENVVVRAEGYIIVGFSGICAKNRGEITNCIFDSSEWNLRIDNNNKQEIKRSAIAAFVSKDNGTSATVSNCYAYSHETPDFWYTSYGYSFDGICGNNKVTTNSQWYYFEAADATTSYSGGVVASTQSAFAETLLAKVNAGQLSETAYNIYLNCINK